MHREELRFKKTPFAVEQSRLMKAAAGGVGDRGRPVLIRSA
jgi:hypothetical protein